MANSRIIRASPSQKQIIKDQTSEIVFENPQISVKKSQEFLKKMTAVAVSSIAYLRGIFPGDAFTEKKLGGVKVYVLNAADDVPGTKTMTEWMKSAFELINSQHLKKLNLVMQQGGTTLEMYTFSFTYNQDTISCVSEIDGKEVQLSQGLPSDISKSVSQLVRSILLITTTLRPLPNDCELSVNLLLDGNTPPEVVPSVFQPSGSDVKLHFPEETSETMKLGKIETKFNTLTVSTRSVLDVDIYSDNSVMPEENIVSQAEGEGEDVVPSSQVEPSASVRNISQLSSGNKEPGHNSKMVESFSVVSKMPERETGLSEALSVVSLKEKKITCICDCGDLFDDTIKCESCHTFQHKTCYKMLQSHNVKAHICVNCHDPDQGKICSVPELISDINRKESALYRQALIFCCNTPRVSCNRIMTHFKVPRRLAEKIFRQLESGDCFQPAADKGNIRTVKEGLAESIGPYFSALVASNDTSMDTNFSPVSSQRTLKVYGKGKRQYDETKENVSPRSSTCSAPKRQKTLETTTKLKNSYMY